VVATIFKTVTNVVVFLIIIQGYQLGPKLVA